MASRTKVAKKKAAKAASNKGESRLRGLTEDEIGLLNGLSKAHAEKPDYPVSDVVGEARALRKIVDKNRGPLFKLGRLTVAVLPDLEARQSMLERAERAWTAARRRTADARLVKAREAAEALERPMIDALKHFLKADGDVQSKVRDIEVGTSDEDTVDDLQKLADLCEANAAELKRADMPAGVVAKARKAADELAEASDTVETDDAPSEARALRDRAYWHLRALMDAVREEGRYVFRNQPAKLTHFRASSTRAMEESRRRKRKPKDEPPKPE